MDPGLYKFIHYLGIFFLLAGIGGLAFADKDKLKLPSISHGMGMFLILLGGFGMQAKLKIDLFSSWFVVKVVIWLALGATLVIAKRQLLPPVATWLLVIALSGVAAWLGLANSVILR